MVDKYKLESLTRKIKTYIEEDYKITDFSGIPTISNIPYGIKGQKGQVCAFSIDLRKSTKMLREIGKEKAGRIHKAFLTSVAEVVKSYGGKIRSYTGDGLLAFWRGDSSDEVSKSIKAAMIVRWLFSIKDNSSPSPLKVLMDQIHEIDFGIGIDCGEVFVFRSGIPGTNHDSDLIFMGECVNFAVFLSQQAKSNYYIQISENTYSMLSDERKFSKSDGKKVDKWVDDEIKGKDNITRRIKKTNWYSYV